MTSGDRAAIRATETLGIVRQSWSPAEFNERMAADVRTQVDILTGFLGSGKTTLLNRLLSDGAFADTAVVVNELGEIGLDHLLVAELSGQVALLEGGCLCCAVSESLPETLLELCRGRAGGELPPFRRIVIETTGLADPGPIATVIRRSPLLAHFLSEGIIVTALDMPDWQATAARHPEALRQIVFADRIVMTKLDLRAGPGQADQARIAALTPLAEIVEASAVLAAPARLLAPVSRDARALAVDDGYAHHSHGVRAWSVAILEPVTHAGLACFFRALDLRLGDRLLRCKGVVRLGGRVVVVQGVGARFTADDARGPVADAPLHLTLIVQGCTREEILRLLPWLHVPEGTMPPTDRASASGPA
jgi:G3E family GTPase